MIRSCCQRHGFSAGGFIPSKYPRWKFDEQTFQLEKENLRSYIETLQEDNKQTMASLKIKETYFTDEAQKSQVLGRLLI